MTQKYDARQREQDRKRGALLGLAIGDCLAQTNVASLGSPMHGAVPLPSDAQLACLLVDSLSAHGSFDVHDVTARYLEWMRLAQVGTESWAALDRLAEVGGDPLQSSRDHWEQLGRRRAGCGALARTAPIGVWLARQPEARRMASLRDCAITHFDLRCQLACVALNTGIAEALTSTDAREAIVDAMEVELELAGELLAVVHPDLADDAQRLSATLLNDMTRARRPDQTIDRPTFPIGDRCPARRALEIAVWELLHAPSFEVGLLDAVYRARDAGGTAAVAGALLGAYHGASAMPQEWRERVLAATADEKLGPLAHRCTAEHLLRLMRPHPSRDDAAPLWVRPRQD